MAAKRGGPTPALRWPVLGIGEDESIKVILLINLPPRGNTTHVVCATPTDPPFKAGKTACGLGFGMGVRVRPYPVGGSPEMAAHLQKHPLCATCVALLTPREPSPPVARVAVATYAVRCPHCFEVQYRSKHAREDGDDTWDGEIFHGQGRFCPSCGKGMTLPEDPAGEARKQAEGA